MQARNPPAGALDGIRLADFTMQLSGPYCTRMLADLGADVIKVERPDRGDDMRHVPPLVDGESAPFTLINRNKRSVVLDLKSPDGLAAARRLAETADVVVENFRPGVVQRLGLDYENLRTANPKVVYCSISGFGQSGPLSSRGGLDLIAQAMTGLMSITGESGGPPLRVPVPISDLCAGLFAAIGILAALQARARTGEGQFIDTSLYEAAMALGNYEAAGFFATGEVPQRMGHAHRGTAPYRAFRARDGWFVVGAANQQIWENLCEAVGAAHLVSDPRYASNVERVRNHQALAEELESVFARDTVDHWLGKLEAAGVPAAPVLTYAEALVHPHAIARQMVMEAGPNVGPIHTLGIPVKLADTPGSLRRPAPQLGEHTAEVLAEIGLAPKAVTSS